TCVRRARRSSSWRNHRLRPPARSRGPHRPRPARPRRAERRMARIDSFLRLVVEQRASDLHLCAGNPPTVRLSGDLVALPFRVLSDLEARRLILEILTAAQRQTVETEKDLDIIYELPGQARFRGNVFLHKHGIGAVFRVISNKIPVL